jgi:hypothetical protein
MGEFLGEKLANNPLFSGDTPDRGVFRAWRRPKSPIYSRNSEGFVVFSENHTLSTKTS